MSATGETSGFTLLEMLVVLTIAGLVAGIGFPRLQAQIAAQEWRTGVAQVRSLLRAARAQAVRSGGVVVVATAADGRSLRMTNADALALPKSVAVAMTQSITFHPDGSASGGLAAVTSGNRTMRIGVAPDTGLASVRPS
ncbi:prepilin-type N-terminal cleavage/methylation domain-containing protein [Sandarakinorhabdus sp.]|uniref:pilus assembly FimT family protein n=1 Tax=Sandarakinorhabdus sp. TaxID=1916663 RepID=UPI00286E8DD5|nr:prepilin-type N-terminal cleavage/methylation domain-containing protein [Sandarakinorhabdus sp.]